MAVRDDPVEPLRWSRELGALASAVGRWRRAVLAGDPLAGRDPFEPWRDYAGRTALQQVEELPVGDPLRAPLRRWVLCLAEQRIDAAAWRERARAERHLVLNLERPRVFQGARVGLWREAITDAPRRGAWLAALERSAGASATAGRVLAERRLEVARRLGLPSPDAWELPVEDAAGLAEAWLARTRDAFESLRADTPEALLGVALAAGAEEGWPARLDLRSVLGLFGAETMVRGLELPAVRLPERLAPASFLRGAWRLGVALSRAAAPRDQPFVIARDPLCLPEKRLGALLAVSTLGRPFLRRRLGLGAPRAAAVERALAASLLLTSRFAALRVLLRRAAWEGARALGGATEELGHAALGVALSPALAGGWPRLEPDDPQRFLALALGAARARELRDRHDEDWLENPRALEELRETARLPPATTVPRPEASAAFDALHALLGDALA